MTDIPKPRTVEFMLAGYDLADALAILARWETLTDAQVRTLGLPGIPVDGRSHPVDSRFKGLRLIPGGRGSDSL